MDKDPQPDQLFFDHDNTLDFRCINHHTAVYLCQHGECEQFFICVEPHCKSNDILHIHPIERRISLRSFVKLMEHHSQQDITLQTSMLKQTKLLKDVLVKSQEQMRQFFYFGMLNEEAKQVAKNFFSGNIENLTAKSLKTLIDSIKFSEKESKQNLTELYGCFNSKFRQIFELLKFENLSSEIFPATYGSFQQFQESLRQSKICKDLSFHKIKILWNLIERPKKLVLVFKASEFEFSPYQFHNECDKYEVTYIFIKTASKKVIVGYTNCRWNKESEAFVTKGYSALIDLDKEQKYEPYEEGKPIIGCFKDSGPIFGNFDIALSLQGMIAPRSHITFPANLNKRGMSSYKIGDRKCRQQLVGELVKDQEFNIEDYEVFVDSDEFEEVF